VPSLRSSCRATVVLAATAALACGMTPVLTASADPVYPSAQQVREAQGAALSKAGQVSAAQAQYAAASARLADVQARAEMAAESYNGARLLLQQRTAAARSPASAPRRPSGPPTWPPTRWSSSRPRRT